MSRRFPLIRSLPLLAVLALVSACAGGEPAVATPDPADVAGTLLAADRAFAAAAEGTDLVAALTAMFAADVVLPAPPGRFATGLPEATAALEADPDNRRSRVAWTPVRAGISADGAHGFTFGYMTVHRPDSTAVPGKYLAYWVKEGGAWKVAAYKRGRRGEGEVDTAAMPPALPAAMVAPTADEAERTAHAESLTAAERAFSDEAQVIGLGPAFAKHGSADAVNMGGAGAPSWIVGADAIAEAVGAGADGPSPVSWGADRVIVASSGDLGVTFGLIVPNAAGADPATQGYPFFTIWRRSGPDATWRYVAE